MARILTAPAHSIEYNALPEEDKLFVWRMTAFLALGFENENAEALALDREVDIGLARSLISQGCSCQLAQKILGS